MPIPAKHKDRARQGSSQSPTAVRAQVIKVAIFLKHLWALWAQKMLLPCETTQMGLQRILADSLNSEQESDSVINLDPLASNALEQD